MFWWRVFYFCRSFKEPDIKIQLYLRNTPYVQTTNETKYIRHDVVCTLLREEPRIVRRIGINEKYFVDFYHRDILFIFEEEEKKEKVKYTKFALHLRNILSYQKRKRERKTCKSFRLSVASSHSPRRENSQLFHLRNNRKPNEIPNRNSVNLI